jgi:hypothetical protein
MLSTSITDVLCMQEALLSCTAHSTTLHVILGYIVVSMQEKVIFQMFNLWWSCHHPCGILATLHETFLNKKMFYVVDQNIAIVMGRGATRGLQSL